MFVQGTWASGTIMATNPDMQLGVFALPINNNVGLHKGQSLPCLQLSPCIPRATRMDLALKFANYVWT